MASMFLILRSQNNNFHYCYCFHCYTDPVITACLALWEALCSSVSIDTCDSSIFQ